MRRRAGAAPPRSRLIGIATTLGFLMVCALGLGSSVALATVGSARVAVTTGPAPNPKPPSHAPDPKPRQTTARPQPPPPPPASSPPPSSAQSPTQPPPAPETTATTTSSPPTRTPARTTVSAAARRPNRVRPISPPKALRRAARVRAAQAERHVQPSRTNEAFGAGASAATEVTVAEQDKPVGAGVMVIFGALIALGFLVVGVSAVPPRRVPWPVVSEPLVAHRSQLATLGIGTIALALLCLNVAVLL